MNTTTKNTPTQSIRILIYGAGAIGSLYAVLFSKAGFSVSVYARGRRLAELEEKGLLYKDGKKIAKAGVTILKQLKDDDRYHFIFLTVRGDQAKAALAELRANKSRTIVTMVNTISDYTEWERLCGGSDSRNGLRTKTHRILPAFPGAGGGIENGVLDAALTPALIQPTTFGEIGGAKTKRARMLAYVFQKSGIPYEIVPDMHHWQLSHLGLVVPLGDACVHYEPMEQVWQDWDVLYHTAEKIRRNFHWFAKNKMLSPARFHLVRLCPTWIAAAALRLFLKSDMGETFGYKHVRKAPDEMRLLHRELYGYIRRHNTPARTAANDNV